MENKLDSYLRAYEGNTKYDIDNEIVLNWYSRRVLNTDKQINSMLDLGLGHGYSAQIFSRTIPDYTVLDGSHDVIEHFVKRFPDNKANIVETFFENYSTTKRYDAIVMGFVLEHVDYPEELLNHFKEFLSDDGRMFIAVPNAKALNRRLGYEMDILPHYHLLSDHDHLLGHQRLYTVELLKQCVELAGYSIIRTEGIYLKPFTTNQMIASDLPIDATRALCVVGVGYPELCCSILMEVRKGA